MANVLCRASQTIRSCPVVNAGRFAERAERPSLAAAGGDERLDIAIDDQDPGVRESLGDRELLANDRGQVPEALQVGRMGIGHQSHVRLGDPRQVGDLARVVGPELGDDDLGLRLGAQQRQRQSDVVVEALARLVDAELLTENVVDDLSRRGFAHRAGEGRDLERFIRRYARARSPSAWTVSGTFRSGPRSPPSTGRSTTAQAAPLAKASRT